MYRANITAAAAAAGRRASCAAPVRPAAAAAARRGNTFWRGIAAASTPGRILTGLAVLRPAGWRWHATAQLLAKKLPRRRATSSAATARSVRRSSEING
ncbi:MAG: hypothetical protein BJ554DRAFT_3656 [Olpidium bornovanus]|uniref:Uncharacterized protein n=1 Tax=Olpidium bornovanus TaxID=278681 RepID=A0A8H7ZNV0_9FUNG|nr:MAG: hypothetical protein BJ554DRAFT_3656 [Olpidium bornovanus]